MQLRCVTCFCADVGLILGGQEGRKPGPFKGHHKQTNPPKKSTSEPPCNYNCPAPDPRGRSDRGPWGHRNRPGSEAKARGGDSPAPGPPRPPSPLGQGTRAPPPGSLTRKRSAARSRDAPALAGRRTGSQRPRSRGGAERRRDCGPEKCGGGVGQQLHQLSPVPWESAPAPAQFAPWKERGPGMGTTHAP